MKKTVLFVDDEPWLQTAIIAVLEAENYKCISKTNATDAVRFISKNNVDILVTDIMMPAGEDFYKTDSSMVGLKLVEFVKAKYPDLPIICLSVIGDQVIINDLKKKGVLYLRKGETPLQTAIDLIKSKIVGYRTF